MENKVIFLRCKGIFSFLLTRKESNVGICTKNFDSLGVEAFEQACDCRKAFLAAVVLLD